jgi:hypothetical protein
MAATADFSWPQVRTAYGQKSGLSRGHGQAPWVVFVINAVDAELCRNLTCCPRYRRSDDQKMGVNEGHTRRVDHLFGG